MSLSHALRGLVGHAGVLRGAAVAGASLGQQGSIGSQQRAASSHAENTNTFLREVCD